MKNLFLVLLMLPLLYSCCNAPQEYYISPDGNDQNTGSLDAPFASIEAAKQAIRKLDKSQREQNITIYLRGGAHLISETVHFGLEDSAPEGYTYTYKAYQGEKPVVSSGVKIQEWKTAEQLPEGIAQDAHGKVLVAEIPSGLQPFYVLFDGDKRIPRAKKEGFEILPMHAIGLADHKDLTNDKKEYNASRSMNVYAEKDRYLLKQFYFNDPRGILKNWENMNEIEVGFAPVPWAMNILPLEKIDFKTKTGYLTIEANAPAGAKNSHTQPWVENVLEYISEGSFVTKGSKVYYWPAEGTSTDNILAPSLIEYFLVAGETNYKEAADVPTKNLAFEGITFMHGNRYTWTADHKGWGIQHDWDKFDNANAMFRFRGAENCSVEACRFTNSGNSALRLDLHCQNITIKNNVIDYVGHMGILLCGYGPGTKDVNKNNTITNNLIHHVGQVITHGAGVFAWQSGENIISHNLIHHVPRKGVGLCSVRTPILAKKWCDFDEGSKTIRWNEIDLTIVSELETEKLSLGEYWKKTLPYLHARNNVVEYNEVYRALEYLADGSVLNVSGAGTGNVVRNNFVHHIASHASGVLRTDDWQRGTTFTKNIIYNSNISGIVHKGHNHIINNMIIDCSIKESIRWASYPDEEADYNSRVQKNIFYESGDRINYYRESYRASEGISLPHNCDTDFNLFWVAENPKDSEKHIKNWNERGVEKNSISADPLFVDVANANFELKPESPAFKLGFEAIDFASIGLTDEFPQEYLKLDVPDDGRRANFHRQSKSGEKLYDFW